MPPLFATYSWIHETLLRDWPFYAFLVVAVGVSVARLYWPFFIQWLNGIRGRDWPSASAVIDIVSVVPQTEETRNGERIVGFAAALTYFYKNPELQMGEFSRMFDEEADAQAWVARYKGRTVIIHVDPRHPSRSVLRKEDL